MSSDTDRIHIRGMVRSFYDTQKLRIQTGNRLVANVRVRLGQEPGKKTEESMSEEGQDFLKVLMLAYRRMADGLAKKSAQIKVAEMEVTDGIILTSFEYELAAHYARLLEGENKLFKFLAPEVAKFPIWKTFLEGVRGCGPTMAAVIISELDPCKAEHISSFWKYAGLDVVSVPLKDKSGEPVLGEDDEPVMISQGRTRKRDHLVEKEYVNRRGEADTRLSITYNPFLKTKLIGVLGTSFLRSASPYAQVYKGYKHRLQTGPDTKDLRPVVIHSRSVRYMVKIFLKDLWLHWREIEGLPIEPDYAEAKFGIVHHKEA
jgi:hypothetical protein